MFNPLTQESEQLDLSPITNALDSVRRAVIANTGQESIEVSNFDEVRLAIKKEIAVLVDKLKPLMLDMCKAMPEMPSEMRVSNFPKMEVMPETMTVSNLSELGDLLTRLITSVEAININPVVNVPAPIVNMPEQMAPVVNIPPMPMQMPLDLSPILAKLDPLKLLSRDPNKPITVRMSDGRSFIDAIANVLKDNGEKMATMVSTSYGLTKDEYKAATVENDATVGHTFFKALSDGVAVQMNASSIIIRYVDISVTNGPVAVGFDNTVLVTSGSEVGVLLYPANLPHRIYTRNISNIWISGANGRRVCYNYYV
jgi:hypothetical protein